MSGDDCGGTSVDDRFLKILEEIARENVISEFKENDPLSYLDLVREFEALKLRVRTENKTKVSLSFPFVAIDENAKYLEGRVYNPPLIRRRMWTK